MMNDDFGFFVKLWRYGITAFVVIVLAGMGSCQATRYQIGRAIEHGADPVMARCAITGGTSGECFVLKAAGN